MLDGLGTTGVIVYLVPFVRTKTIKGNTYYYLVEGVRDGAKVRQRVLLYLGRYASVQEAHAFWKREAREGQSRERKQYARSMVKALRQYL